MSATPIDLGSCDQAFEALKSYDRGSARASLLPIDQAVIAALKDAKTRAALERKLLQALKGAGPTVGREYVCTKLTLLGSDAAVAALAALAGDAQLSTAARNALQAISGSAADKALRKALTSTSGTAKVGIINSIAARRDAAAVGPLSRCLEESDEQVSAAAAAALGAIATVKAARALREHFVRTPEVRRRRLADAMLVCSERLANSGRQADAEAMAKLLLAPGQPAYVQHAAELAMASRQRTKQ